MSSLLYVAEEYENVLEMIGPAAARGPAAEQNQSIENCSKAMK